MPIPSPKSEEEKKKFISRCIKTMHHRDPNRSSKQIKGICYSRWEDKQKKKEK